MTRSRANRWRATVVLAAAWVVAAWASAEDGGASGDTRRDLGRQESVSPEIPASSLRTTLESSLATSRSPAEVWASRQWLNDMEPYLTRFLKDPARRRELLYRVYHEARLAGLPPALVLAVIQVESAFQPAAVSSAGAVGLMQIMPFWIRELGIPADDLKDSRRNLRYGCTILAHYLAVEGGDLTRALARYNGSLGETWYPERVMRAWQANWRAPGLGDSAGD